MWDPQIRGANHMLIYKEENQNISVYELTTDTYVISKDWAHAYVRVCP